MSEESEFDMWVCACAASNCFIYRLEQVGDCVLYVSRVQEKDRFGNFKHSPRYNAFKAGKRLICDTNYVAAYAVWERAAGLAQDDLNGLARYEASK